MILGIQCDVSFDIRTHRMLPDVNGQQGHGTCFGQRSVSANGLGHLEASGSPHEPSPKDAINA